MDLKQTIILKTDVDTYEGLRKGVPNLINIFDKYNIRATFFIAMGYDNSGKAVFNIFRQKGF